MGMTDRRGSVRRARLIPVDGTPDLSAVQGGSSPTYGASPANPNAQPAIILRE